MWPLTRVGLSRAAGRIAFPLFKQSALVGRLGFPSGVASIGRKMADDVDRAIRYYQMSRTRWRWKQSRSPYEVRVQCRGKVVLNPLYSFGTVGCRGTIPLSARTIAFWQVDMESILYGTSIMFGVGNINTPLKSYNFIDLLGFTEHSWGVSHKGMGQHNGVSFRVCDPFEESDCRVGVLFDGPNHRLCIFGNGQYLATPFLDMDTSETLFPILTSTAQKTRVKLTRQVARLVIPSLLALALREARSFPSSELVEVLPNDVLFLVNAPEHFFACQLPPYR